MKSEGCIFGDMEAIKLLVNRKKTMNKYINDDNKNNPITHKQINLLAFKLAEKKGDKKLYNKIKSAIYCETFKRMNDDSGKVRYDFNSRLKSCLLNHQVQKLLDGKTVPKRYLPTVKKAVKKTA